MAEALDVINAFATPLKVAWVVWLAWGVGQFFWYRHERSGAAAPKRAAGLKPVAKRPAVALRPAAPPVEAPVLGRLITPQHVAARPRPEPKVEREVPVAQVVPVAPAFDPATAVIETFGAAGSDTALDRVVADFEMQDAHSRRRNRPADVRS